MKKNIPKREYFQAMKNHEGKLQKEIIQIKQKETQSNILIGAYINVFHIWAVGRLKQINMKLTTVSSKTLKYITEIFDKSYTLKPQLSGLDETKKVWIGKNPNFTGTSKIRHTPETPLCNNRKSLLLHYCGCVLKFIAFSNLITLHI